MPCTNVMYILFILALAIGVYHTLLILFFKGLYTHNDLLGKMIINSKKLSYTGKLLPWEEEIYVRCCSIWPLTHFILHLIMGYLFPECWGILLVSGFAWEAVESFIGSLPIHPKLDKNNEILEGQYTKNWWYGNRLDIVANILGLAGGIGLNKLTTKY